MSPIVVTNSSPSGRMRRVGGVAASSAFEHLRPTANLPLDSNGVALQFNSTTGRIEGSVYNTSWMTRAWMIANATTVKTVKTSGGDYTPAQFGTALSDATTANDVRVIVIDSGLTVDITHTVGRKGASPNWTFIVSSNWWSGAWAPSTSQWIDVDAEASNLATLVPTGETLPCFEANGTQRDKWAFVGIQFKRNTTGSSFNCAALVVLNVEINGTSTSTSTTTITDTSQSWATDEWAGQTLTFAARSVTVISNTSNTLTFSSGTALTPGQPYYIRPANATQMPQHWAFRHCWFNGVWASSGSYYRTTRGIAMAGRYIGIECTAMTGFAGSETQAFNSSWGAGKFRIAHCIAEASGQCFMFGGGPTVPSFTNNDIEVYKCYMVKRQEFNPLSSVFQSSTTVKANWEIKSAIRFLIHECVAENTFGNGSENAMAMLKRSNEGSSTDITIHLCKHLKGGIALLMEVAGSNPDAQTDPLTRVSVRGTLFEEALLAAQDGSSIGVYTAGGSVTLPDLQVEYCTFVSRRAAGMNNNVLVPDGASYSPLVVSNNVFDFALYGWKTNTLNGAEVATSVSATVGWNVQLPIDAGFADSRRPSWQTPYPDQYTAALWVADRTVFSNYASENYALASATGIGENGTTSGADFTLLNTVTTGLRSRTPSFITVEFV